MYIHILGQCYLVYECACVQLNEVRYGADRRRRLQKMTSYTECDVPRLDVLNTANLCPAVSVVGLFCLLTVMYALVWFGTLVHFRCEVY